MKKSYIKRVGKRTKRWQATRREYLKGLPEEERRCAISGCTNQDLEVDHILGRGRRPDLVNEISNLQLLCSFHHHEKTFYGGI